MYEADVPLTGMLSDAYIFRVVLHDTADHAYDEEPPEVTTTGET